MKTDSSSNRTTASLLSLLSSSCLATTLDISEDRTPNQSTCNSRILLSWPPPWPPSPQLPGLRTPRESGLPTTHGATTSMAVSCYFEKASVGHITDTITVHKVHEACATMDVSKNMGTGEECAYWTDNNGGMFKGCKCSGFGGLKTWKHF